MSDIRAIRWGTAYQIKLITFCALRPLTDAEMDAMPDNCAPESFPDIAEKLRAHGLKLELNWDIREMS